MFKKILDVEPYRFLYEPGSNHFKHVNPRFFQNADARRQRITVFILSLAVILFVLGGGQTNDNFSILGTGIIFERPVILVAAFISIFFYSRHRFRLLAWSGGAPTQAWYMMDDFLQRHDLYRKRYRAFLEKYRQNGDFEIRGFARGAHVTPNMLNAELRFEKIAVGHTNALLSSQELAYPDPVLRIAKPVYWYLRIRSYLHVLIKTQIGSDFLVPNVVMNSAMLLGIYRIVKDNGPSIIQWSNQLIDF